MARRSITNAEKGSQRGELALNSLARRGLLLYTDAPMGIRRVQQGIETQTLAIQPGICPVCQKGLNRNVTFLTGGWGRCVKCNEVVHYGCLSGGKFLKSRP